MAKLASYIYTGPIKTTPLDNNSNNLEQNEPPPLNSKDVVTAIGAVVKAGPKLRPSAKNIYIAKQKLVVRRKPEK